MGCGAGTEPGAKGGEGAPQATVPTGSYTLYYHGACKKFTGRGSCVLALLEEAGAKYTVEEPAAWKGSPIFAVPAIKTPLGNEASQSTAIMIGLGDELGFTPTKGKMTAMQISCDAADFLSESSSFADKPDR